MRRFLVPAFAVLLAAAVVLPASGGDPLYLWRVDGPAATVHMTGSIHVGRPEFFPLPGPLEEAFATADALAVEVDVTDAAAQQQLAMLMMQKAMLPAGESLQDHLDAGTWKRLEEFAATRGLPLEVVSRFRPGIAAMLMAMQEYQNAGFDESLGIDKHFLDQAKAAGKPVRQLETLEDQLEIFLEVSDGLDDLLIDEMLDQVDGIAEMFERMVALWQAGDAEGMDRFMAEMNGDEPELVDFYRRLLDDRNVAMADSLDVWLKGDRDVFVVVGAGHFGGGNGLVRLLEGKGWTVEQVER